MFKNEPQTTFLGNHYCRSSFCAERPLGASLCSVYKTRALQYHHLLYLLPVYVYTAILLSLKDQCSKQCLPRLGPAHPNTIIVRVCARAHARACARVNKTKPKVERYLTCIMCSIHFIFKMLIIQ